MNKTRTHMADGRELIYYDLDPDASRVLEDPRDLPTAQTASELRYDALTDEWVAVASHRQSRTHKPPSDQCPLCPSDEEHQTEIPSPSYDVVVFENRFPSFATDVAPLTPVPGEELDTPRRAPGRARCEVVCFTDAHDGSFADLTPAEARNVVDAWADRTTDLSGVEGVAQVFPFENRGDEIGVTLPHPHGQIYGYPFVPPRTRRMLDAARAYRDRTLRDLFSDVLAAERKAGARVVAENEHWTAFVPAAARWPVEVHLYPRRRVVDLPGLAPEQRDGFATLYLDVLRRLDRLFDMPLPYIAAWHQAPVHSGRDLAYLHLEVFSIRRAPDKLKYLAGSESGMDVFINDIAPEQMAERLRDLA